jgi:hypothetical protein
MDFRTACEYASVALQNLKFILRSVEAAVTQLAIEEQVDEMLVLAIVKMHERMTFQLGRLNDVYMPKITAEQPAIAQAYVVARDEIMRSYEGARTDFERLVMRRTTAEQGQQASLLARSN